MVRLLLAVRGRLFLFCAEDSLGIRRVVCAGLLVAGLAVMLVTSAGASKRSKDIAKDTLGPSDAPDLLMDGGRKLTFERSFSLEREVKPKRSFWTRVVDVIAGEPDFHYLVSPYSIATDSHGRVIVTDPGADGIHIFDF